MVRGRFAPSPTGRMHLGNALSALLAWLSVRAQGGKMLLRMEDIDPDRSRKEYALQLMDDMRFLGLDWDEGPLWQSQRAAEYERALKALSAHTYPCFCSRAELHAASAPHASDGTFIYDGRCRDLSPTQRAELAQRRRAAIRIRVPDEVVAFTDGCRGEVRQNLAAECGDFLLRRSDGAFAYQLAVVVDDAAMGVTEVVRGGDLLDSTPRQIWLHRMLGSEPPRYFHTPLLLARDGRRLSKRERDLDMGALRARFSAEEIVGRLAWLAGLRDSPAPASAAQLVSEFRWERVYGHDLYLPDDLFR